MKNKLALVTGSSSGIGLEVARALVQQGAKVAVVASSDIAKARKCACEIDPTGMLAFAFAGDVSTAEGARALVRSVNAELGPIDILVNSAGVFYATPMGEIDPPQAQRMVDVNLLGMVYAIDAVTQQMKERGAGKIVNLASVAGISSSPRYALYAATKAGVIALTRAVGVELAPFGINVNAIAPGNTETPINEEIRTSPEHAAARERIARLTPSKRLFTPPQEIAGGILFLLSDAARGMYGATLSIDEGRAAGVPAHA